MTPETTSKQERPRFLRRDLLNTPLPPPQTTTTTTAFSRPPRTFLTTERTQPTDSIPVHFPPGHFSSPLSHILRPSPPPSASPPPPHPPTARCVQPKRAGPLPPIVFTGGHFPCPGDKKQTKKRTLLLCLFFLFFLRRRVCQCQIEAPHTRETYAPSTHVA